MDSGATKREILGKKLEKRLQDPKTEPLISLPLDFLEGITCGFSTERELGRGLSGVVYKGILRSGKAIAVKKIFYAHLQGNDNQVENEIIYLTEVRHQNVVQLVGYCVQTKSEVMEHSGKHVMVEKRACLLCFEFLCNGSLDKHLSEMRIQQVQQCISIALKCLEPESNKRPTSLDIVQSLNAVEPKCTSPGNSPSVVEKSGAPEYRLAPSVLGFQLAGAPLSRECRKDRRNWNLQSQVNVNIINIPKTTSAINGLNECANLFQWVTSAISSPKPQLNETQKERLQRDICQLHSDLQCLTDTLPAIDNLIDRAEWRIHHDSVADLLSRLKDAVYDAEDLLDEFRWYEKKVSVESNAIAVEPVIKFFQSVTQGNFNKVTGIQKRLDNLSKQLEKQGLLPAIPKFDKSSRPETSFFSTEAKMIGRDEEKKKLIMLLGVPTNKSSGRSGCKRKRRVSSSTSNQVCATIDSNEATIVSVRVLPIVGIGGAGKTTLAQDICNHSKVKGHFDLIIWICVSDYFDVKRLTKEAIEQTSGEVLENGNLNSLQLALANSVNKKRFLIVLDDMWDENEEHWKHFCAPFKNALQGSMMLVTTRSPKVADVVRTMDSFPLEGLKDDVFRKFFKSCVFGPNSSNIDPKLERIGEKILPKLRGSPLAAKTLGRLLGMSLELAHWDRILKSQLWELQQKETDILPALRLSYMYLPLYLKRCFSFCAVYPKDYIFKKEDLVEIWVAEGLVEHHTGGQYFEELAHLSFFQKYPRSHKKYVIHDLMHDMAQLVSKDECFILRTLFCHLSLKSEADNTVMEKWCNELLCMRVMVCSISKWGLPGNISNMKLLRYLQLQILDSSLCKSLPSAFCCLYNMQIFNATKWSIDDIPSGFGMLINLQKFESVKCQFHHIHPVGTLKGATDQGQKSQFELKNYNGDSLPNSEQVHSYDSTNSTLLSVTDVVIHSCQNLSSLEQFLQPGYVPTIKKIEISDCGSLESVPADRFGDLHFLEVLSVSKCPNIKSRRLFAPSLKKLYLEDSGDLGHKIECSSLTILHLLNCPLESIELQMRNLPLLQELEISSCPSLTVIIDSEPISCDILQGEARSRAIDHTFVSLTDVEITNCSNLSSQEQFLQPVYMPIIMEIKNSNCRNLESVPTDRFGDFRFLEVLSVSHCPKIKSRHLFAPSLKKLYLEDSGDLGYKIECSSLTIMHLSNCPLESIELQMCNLRLLQELKIRSCPSLTVIRDSEPISSDILHGEARSRAIDNTVLSLTDVEITDCRNLSSQEQFLQPGYVPIIKKIEISNCRSLASVPTERFVYFRLIEVLSVSHCPKIKSEHLFAPSLKKLYLENFGHLGYKIQCSSLTILHLSNCPLESIELQMWNLPLLQELEISSCPSLTIIRGSEHISSGIFHGEDRNRTTDSTFKSLTDVVIHSCQNLSSLEQFLQPAYVPIIKKIEIYYCRSLQSVPTDLFGDLCFLEVLRVSHCPLIKSEHLFAPSLKELYLVNSGNLGGNIECSSLTILQLSDCLLEAIELQVRNLPLLQNLEIIRCSSLTIIRDSEPISTDLFHGGAQRRMGKFPLLAHLTIVSCEKLKTIDDLLYLPAVERISIMDCGLLSLLAHRLGSFPRLKDLKISACQGLNWQSGMLLARSLQQLTLWNCGDFSAWLPSCLENLTFLESLEIRGCECIVSVPGHLWSSNLRSLQRLMFYSCSKLKSIGGPGAITHIRDLCIDDCPELKEIDQPLRRGSFL
ncbi:unnamed protein product [Miscanthus lutarioriparius]|uniref:Protein kinase domain-containing protein n=1 Tax=Miscanthus lutarioriparius TaxID=422564 RepID=A0A811NIB6_9POAL|nr:unnamed protein product [Miscanthus lutarioriparius]